jgi:peptidylamidoglycolate lyase
MFHRVDRTWGEGTFDYSYDLEEPKVIKGDTVFHVNGETGEVMHSWGSDFFYLPHGITLDFDFVWLTDVGSHMIHKFHHNGTLVQSLGTKLENGKSRPGIDKCDQ